MRHTMGSNYTSLSTAQRACASDRACSGVYDRNCDGTAPFSMCKGFVSHVGQRKRYTYEYTSKSCVYAKQNTSGARDAHMLASIHPRTHLKLLAHNRPTVKIECARAI